MENWQNHFRHKNLLINGLIALLPAAIIGGIIVELGAPSITRFLVFVGTIYIIGEIREKYFSRQADRK